MLDHMTINNGQGKPYSEKLYVVKPLLHRHLPFTKLTNCLDHVVELSLAHAGVEADPESVVHDRVGVREIADDTIVNAFDERIKARMFDEVARKEVARLDVVCLQMLRKVVARESRVRLHRHQKAKPTRL